MRLPTPNFEVDHAFKICASSIIDTDESNLMKAISAAITCSSNDYIRRATEGTTWMIPPLTSAHGKDPAIIGTIRKSHLNHLYNYYMVKRPEGRKIYDELMISTDDCPMCGGIGHTRTLDHYLPKAHYPRLSVLPHNLIPACRDCNTGKGNPIANSADKQLIHPYYDKQCFFDDCWIAATVSQDVPYLMTFHASPPSFWDEVDKRRAKHHFASFKLAEGYARLAGSELSVLVDQRRGFMRRMGEVEFSDYLNSIGQTQSLKANHWRKVMYRSLAADKWFCSAAL